MALLFFLWPLILGKKIGKERSSTLNNRESSVEEKEIRERGIWAGGNELEGGGERRRRGGELMKE